MLVSFTEWMWPAGVVLVVALLTGVPLGAAGRTVTLNTTLGQVVGVQQVMSGLPVNVYLGLPYGLPPRGGLRFAHPRLWGTGWIRLDATHQRPLCPTLDLLDTGGQVQGGTGSTGKVAYSEDCLYLNIFAPQRDFNTDRVPVLVLLTSRSRTGQDWPSPVDGRLLATRGIVVVSVSYRTGPLGFLSSGTAHVRGNAGLLDQVVALQWVRTHIADFGGEPGKITLAGHGKAGVYASLHMVSPFSKGLFHRVIAMDGVAPFKYDMWSRARPKEGVDMFKVLTSVLGCSHRDVEWELRCLREGSLRSLLLAANNTAFSIFDDPWGPVVDGHMLPDEPTALWRHATLDKGLLIGSTTSLNRPASQEAVNFEDLKSHIFHRAARSYEGEAAYALTTAVLHEYRSWRSTNMSSSGSTQYTELKEDEVNVAIYQMCHEVSRPSEQSAALNGSDGIYRYVYYSAGGAGEFIDLLFGAPLVGQGRRKWTARDRATSKALITMWTNFVKTGDPAAPTNVSWHPYTPEKQDYLEISNDLQARQYYRQRQMAFWTEYKPVLLSAIDQRIMNGTESPASTRECNTSREAVEKEAEPDPYYLATWLLCALCIFLCITVIGMLFVLHKHKSDSYSLDGK